MKKKAVLTILAVVIIALIAVFALPWTSFSEKTEIVSAIAITVKTPGHIDSSSNLEKDDCAALSALLSGAKGRFMLRSEDSFSDKAWTKITFGASDGSQDKYWFADLYIAEDAVYMYRDKCLLGQKLTGLDADAIRRIAEK